MIKQFNNVECRESAIIYQSNLEQIKKLYTTDPVMAGELAISVCEMALTGQCSTDNGMIGIILENFKVSSNKNKAKYDNALEAKRQKKIKDQQLDRIAVLLDSGKNQIQIASILGVSRQTINTRIGVMRKEFPELLSSKKDLTLDEENQENQENVKENGFTPTLHELDMSSVSSSVKYNDNVNDNVNIEQFASQTIPLISLEELNQMGVLYEQISEDKVRLVKTGRLCQLKIGE